MAKHTVTLSPSEVEAALQKALSHKYGKFTVKPLLSTRAECIDPWRGDTIHHPHFDGIEITYDE